MKQYRQKKNNIETKHDAEIKKAKTIAYMKKKKKKQRTTVSLRRINKSEELRKDFT